MMNKSNAVEDVVRALSAVKRVAVVSHYNPDPDAYGSSCALTLALASKGLEVVCCNESPLVDRYRFIPGSAHVSNSLPEQCDAIIICDCGELSRVGDLFKAQLQKYSSIVNIDHHASNDFFGHVNFVDERASSTSELIYFLIKALDIQISPDIATALFVGISGDTGSFRYASTSAKTMKIAADLVEKGAQPNLISRELWGNRPLSAVKLHAEAFSRMKMHAGGKIAELVVDEEIYSHCNALPEDTEDLVERARDIRGVSVAVLIKRDVDIWRISMRSIDVRFDVSQIAEDFGGGGHRVAAAFRWRKDLQELQTVLIPKLEKLVL